MPKANAEGLPENLKPYVAHGVHLDYKPGAKEATGECPFCGKSGKFSVKVETTQWKCWSCPAGQTPDKPTSGGNARTFVQLVYEQSFQQTTYKEYAELAAERKLLDPQTLIDWGLAKSYLTHSWLLPGWGVDGSWKTAYVYLPVQTSKGPKRRALPTATLGHHLFGVNCYNAAAHTVYLCEGPWDGLAVYEVLGAMLADGTGSTSNKSRSMLSEHTVIATPGANVFFNEWSKLFSEKTVVLLLHNDHPRTNEKTGAVIPPAALVGAKRVSEILAPVAEAVNWRPWSEHGFRLDLPDGCDARDYFGAGVGWAQRG